METGGDYTRCSGGSPVDNEHRKLMDIADIMYDSVSKIRFFGGLLIDNLDC